MIYVKVDKQTGLVVGQNSTPTNPDPSLFLEIETDFVFLNKNNDYRWNAADSTFYDVGTKPQIVEPTYQTLTPFASKYIYIDGVKKSLYKRVHGVNATIAANSSGNIDFTIPYSACKFSGANVFGVDLGDTLDFYVLDDSNNTCSGLDVGTYGPNVTLNQFGFNVEMPAGGVYENSSNYDSDLNAGMVIRCTYKNNGSADKYISMNLWIHEVK